MKPKQEELRWDMVGALIYLGKLQRRYQDEQRKAETRNVNKLKTKELQKAIHEMVSICSSVKDNISFIKDDISFIKEFLIDLRPHIQEE